MAPLKSSLAKSVGKLLGVQQDTDLSLRGATQSIHSRKTALVQIPFRFAMFGGGGSGAGWVGGGGGGGGYVEEELASLFTGVTYTVTIGAAGATPGPAPPGLLVMAMLEEILHSQLQQEPSLHMAVVEAVEIILVVNLVVLVVVLVEHLLLHLDLVIK